MEEFKNDNRVSVVICGDAEKGAFGFSALFSVDGDALVSSHGVVVRSIDYASQSLDVVTQEAVLDAAAVEVYSRSDSVSLWVLGAVCGDTCGLRRHLRTSPSLPYRGRFLH